MLIRISGEGSSSALSSASRREQTFHGAARTMTTNVRFHVMMTYLHCNPAALQATTDRLDCEDQDYRGKAGR